jgi:hypothetical protein
MNLTSMLIHKVVYWAPVSTDGFGKRTFAQPVEMDARWLNKEEEYADKNARIQRSRSVVYSGTELEEGGYLYKGRMLELTQSDRTNPESCVGARIINVSRSSSSIDGVVTLYKALV